MLCDVKRVLVCCSCTNFLTLYWNNKVSVQTTLVHVLHTETPFSKSFGLTVFFRTTQTPMTTLLQM